MRALLSSLSSSKRGPAAEAIDSRLASFRAMRSAPAEVLFSELCFCLLAANYSAKGSLRIQEGLGPGLLELDQPSLSSALRSYGYRFPNTRARYIREARRHIDDLPGLVRSHDESGSRLHLADEVLGLGMKEASHFLRNCGAQGLAIVDFHIIDILMRHGLIEPMRRGGISRRRYLELESVLRDLASRAGMSLAELDLHLWRMETGQVLK